MMYLENKKEEEDTDACIRTIHITINHVWHINYAIETRNSHVMIIDQWTLRERHFVQQQSLIRFLSLRYFLPHPNPSLIQGINM